MNEFVKFLEEEIKNMKKILDHQRGRVAEAEDEIYNYRQILSMIRTGEPQIKTYAKKVLKE